MPEKVSLAARQSYRGVRDEVEEVIQYAAAM
jgi:hypothetical protein